MRVSFEVTRGDVPAVLEQASGAGILTTVVACGRPAVPSTARSRLAQIDVLQRSRGLTLIHREGRIDRLPILIYYDGSPPARRGLEIVGILRHGRRNQVRVLLPPAPTETSMRLVAEVEDFRREHGIRVVVQQLASNQESDLTRTLEQFSRSLIVLPARASVLRRGAAASVLESASAVLVVR